MKAALPWLAASVLLHGLALALPRERVPLRIAHTAALELELVSEASAGRSESAGEAEQRTGAAPARRETSSLAAVTLRRERRAERARAAPAEPFRETDSMLREPRAKVGPAPAERRALEPLTAGNEAPASAAPAEPVLIASANASSTVEPVGPAATDTLRTSSGSGQSADPASVAPGVAGSGASTVALRALRSRYLGALRQRVLERREYPYRAERAGLQGVICLRLSLDATGRLSQLRVTCGPSPEPLLQAALRAVRAAEPFAPLPSALGTSLTVDLPIVFQLHAP